MGRTEQLARGLAGGAGGVEAERARCFEIDEDVPPLQVLDEHDGGRVVEEALAAGSASRAGDRVPPPARCSRARISVVTSRKISMTWPTRPSSASRSRSQVHSTAQRRGAPLTACGCFVVSYQTGGSTMSSPANARRAASSTPASRRSGSSNRLYSSGGSVPKMSRNAWFVSRLCPFGRYNCSPNGALANIATSSATGSAICPTCSRTSSNVPRIATRSESPLVSSIHRKG